MDNNGSGGGDGGRGAATAPIPDEEQGADLPLTMSASVVLTGLPRDAHQALVGVDAIDSGKGESLWSLFIWCLHSCLPCLFSFFLLDFVMIL